MLLLVIGSVYAVAVARLAIWRIAPESRRVTVGMLAIAAASTLYLRHVGETIIDPRDWFGANLSDLGQHLLTLVGCYAYGASSLQTTWGERPLRYWRTAMALAAIGLLVTYLLGNEWSVPSEEFALSDAASIAHDWIELAALTAAFAVVAFAARRALKDGGHRYTTMVSMYVLGFVGTACPIMIGTLLIVDPSLVRQDYHDLAFGWTLVGLIVLAVAGSAGLVTAWRRRNDPRAA